MPGKAGLPVIYRKDPPYIVTYNFADVLRGNSYLKYYGALCLEGAAADKYYLSSEIISSNWAVTGSISTWTVPPHFTAWDTDTASTYEKIGDLDFDILIDRTIGLKGDALVELTGSILGSGAARCKAYFIAKLRKDTGSEVDIGNCTSSILNRDGSSGTTTRRLPLIINIASKVMINKGDILRLTIEVWMDSSSAANQIALYHEPDGTATADGFNSALILNIPVQTS